MSKGVSAVAGYTGEMAVFPIVGVNQEVVVEEELNGDGRPIASVRGGMVVLAGDWLPKTLLCFVL